MIFYQALPVTSLTGKYFKCTDNMKITVWRYTGGCIEWDSKEWDRLFLIGATREILEIRKEWDSIEWDN